MIILWKNILISFYGINIEKAPFNPDVVWHYTLKRFADLALAQAHEATRPAPPIAVSYLIRGGDPPSPSLSLSEQDSRLTPLATLGECRIRGSFIHSLSHEGVLFSFSARVSLVCVCEIVPVVCSFLVRFVIHRPCPPSRASRSLVFSPRLRPPRLLFRLCS
jgi:hypothetical protein